MSEFTAFSLFSGAGGLDLGFKQAGFSIGLTVDNDADSLKTRELNSIADDGINLCGDVCRLSVCCENGKSQITIDQNLPRWNNAWLQIPDVVIGGPPCQAFSVMGNQDPEDVRATMVGQFIRIVKQITPKAFVLENVPPLLKSGNAYIEAARNHILDMRESGYQVTPILINGKDFGIPQSRERVFFVGIRKPLPSILLSAVSASQTTPRTAREVLLEIGKDGRGEVPNVKAIPCKRPVIRGTAYAGMLFNGQGRPVDLKGCSGTLLASMGGSCTPIIDDAALYENKENWTEWYHKYLVEGGKPLAVTDVPSSVRRMTVVEAAAFQGFPRDFRFYGCQSSQYRQIGNAVPPPMAKAIALAVLKSLTSSDK